MTEAQSAPQFTTAEFEPELVDSTPHFVRGLVFGAGGALAGLVLYAAVVIITNYEIGFVSLAVGWIVGKSILFGSSGRTGRRYQVAALLLTYFSVSMATVPIVIYQVIKLNRGVEAPAEAGADAGKSATTAPAASATAGATEEGSAQPVSLGEFAGTLLWLGLASPFLGLQEMPSGLIGLIILGVGLQIAWKLTGSRQLAVQQAISGPPAEEEKPTTLNIGR